MDGRVSAPRHLVTAHQANYLPYLGFFQKILVSDLFVLVDDTQFVKRGAFGWIHRNRILGSDGEPLWLTVPALTHDRYDQKISEVEIDNRRDWRRKHWRSLALCYAKAPHFKEHAATLEAIYAQPWTHLLPLSRALIEWFLAALSIRTPLRVASEYGITGQGSDYVLELARKTGATHYLSGTHGRDYLKTEDFAAASCGLVFQDFTCLSYPQGRGERFQSHLCALDALFWNGADGTRRLLEAGARYEIPAL